MTRLNISLLASPKPSSVTLCELGIAAGATGHSVTLCYQDFPRHPCSAVSRSIVTYPWDRAKFSGTSFLRAINQDAEQIVKLTLGVEDYEQVRILLQTRLIAAADMVRRANVYVGVK